MSGDDFKPLVFPAAPGLARVVPRERLTAYERWELPLLEERIQQAAEQLAGHELAPHTEPLPTAGELQALHDQAWKEGWQAGLEEGRGALNARLTTLNRAIEQASGLLASAEEALAPRLLDLVVAMAREVIRAELRLQTRIAARGGARGSGGDAGRQRGTEHPSASGRCRLDAR